MHTYKNTSWSRRFFPFLLSVNLTYYRAFDHLITSMYFDVKKTQTCHLYHPLRRARAYTSMCRADLLSSRGASRRVEILAKDVEGSLLGHQ